MKESLATHLFQEELYDFSAGVIAVLPREWHSYTAEEKVLLEKILTSVKVSIHSVHVIVQPSLDLSALCVYRPAKVLIFGATGSEDIGTYQATAAQGFMVIRADDLNLLDEQKKKDLWMALRQMFAV